ncbi:CATRA system-associated protein [Nonomuraea sp. NPDC048826]|uniref:CATRA system-associated protein n=1 Tax=Nonomuraea sp. NPDC048826 TaxID=3364347 RepID=UPI003716B105
MGVHGEAVGLLREALTWKLPAAEWAGVAAAVGRLESSDDVRGDLGHLELAGPMRIVTRHGDQPVTPMPDDLRERVNELIHTLSAPDAEDPDGAG